MRTYYLQPYWEYNPKTRKSTLIEVIMYPEEDPSFHIRYKTLEEAVEKNPTIRIINWNGTVLHEPTPLYCIECRPASDEPWQMADKIVYFDLGHAVNQAKFYNEKEHMVYGMTRVVDNKGKVYITFPVQ